MSRTQGAIIAIFVLVVGAMGIVACGGGDDAKTSATATSQPQSTNAAAATTRAAGGGQTTAAATAAATTSPANATQPPNGGGGASDACGLLTKAEVEEALGEMVNAPDVGDSIDTPISGGTAAVSTCGWTSASYASSISLTFWNAPGLNQGIAGMINLACTNKQSVDVGADSACWYDAQGVEIQAAKGGFFLDMFATMSGDASNVLHDLMSKAISRVP